MEGVGSIRAGIVIDCVTRNYSVFCPLSCLEGSRSLQMCVSSMEGRLCRNQPPNLQIREGGLYKERINSCI